MKLRWPVYLDNAATTPVDPRVAARMAEVLQGSHDFGNAASATHAYGERAAELIEVARGQVAACVNASAAEVLFTSGATEANNLAIFGTAHYYRDYGRHIVTARTEHKAVLDPCRELERRGWQVTYLVPDSQGRVSSAAVAAALRDDTVLVSLMLVNNETGLIQDLPAISPVCAAHGGVHLHVDAAQAVGKVSVDFAGLGASLMSLSAHKAYGPKGAGALVVSARGRGTHLTPLQFGGGQEGGVRSGTLATHQVVGMGLAFELAARHLPEEGPRIAALQERLWRGIEALGGVWRNGCAGDSVPQLLNVSFGGVEGESLLAAVSERIAVSTGSACSSASQDPSYVLRALGRSELLSESSLRFGLGRFTQEEHIATALGALREAVPRLRRIAGEGAPA
jgi:cysteine desulfurase